MRIHLLHKPFGHCGIPYTQSRRDAVFAKPLVHVGTSLIAVTFGPIETL